MGIVQCTHSLINKNAYFYWWLDAIPKAFFLFKSHEGGLICSVPPRLLYNGFCYYFFMLVYCSPKASLIDLIVRNRFNSSIPSMR